ncbi:MAG: DASS family sodium-coupled anion symporter, partial [Planctomycetes bacterium]|nr:DASS family sodium-coupled anion symporter [Planctomycetota bacterium]
MSRDAAGNAGVGQRVGLWLGPAAFAFMLLLPGPGDLSAAGWRTAAVAAWMAIWWVTEAVPIPATALLPLVLLPLAGIADMAASARSYANELVFLQMGGFMLAAAMERWGLHKRIALSVVSLVGTGPRRLVLGFMVASAFVSMWISNTATTAMMLPIALAVGRLFRPLDSSGPYELGICLLLGIAYASTMGGVATLIGTPPNVVLAAQASKLLGVEIGFVDWMLVGVPMTVLLVPAGWLLLVRLFPPEAVRADASQLLAEQRRGLGPLSRGELSVAVVFVCTALAWVVREPKAFGSLTVPGIGSLAPAVKDSTIAMVAAVVLFALPVDRRRGVFVLDWNTAREIPWGVLVLFGGGLSLAEAMRTSGLAAWIGATVAGLHALPAWLVVLTVAALFVFLTEVTSNLATATMAMPVMAGAASGLGVDPLVLMSAAALSASMAFMLPVATPPNAIVFG